MADEGRLWDYLRERCAGSGAHLVRIENAVAAGTPDVNGCLGVEWWWELKYLPQWPKRACTVVRIDHYTAEQRLWLLARGRAGGNAMLLLQVDRTYMLFNWFYAQAVGRLVRHDLLRVAAAVWVDQVDVDELLWLSRGCGPVLCNSIRSPKKVDF